METSEFNKRYINVIKEWILSEKQLADAGYSTKEIFDIEDSIDNNPSFEGENDMEKRYCKAYAASIEMACESLGAGITPEEFTRVIDTAEMELYTKALI